MNTQTMLQCDDSHREEVLLHCRKNPGLNCFLIGDLENFSLKEEFMDLWTIKKNDAITSTLLRFYRYYTAETHSEEDASRLAKVIKADPRAHSVSGSEKTVSLLKKHLPFLEVTVMDLAELKPQDFTPQTGCKSEEVKVEQAGIENIEELFMFQKGIEEFGITDELRETFGQEIKSGTGRTVYVRKEGRIVSSATISTENSINGIILGVATAAEARRKGYARTCLNALCSRLAAAGKSAVLFYHDADAGKLYSSTGFRDIGKWVKGEF